MLVTSGYGMCCEYQWFQIFSFVQPNNLKLSWCILSLSIPQCTLQHLLPAVIRSSDYSPTNSNAFRDNLGFSVFPRDSSACWLQRPGNEPPALQSTNDCLEPQGPVLGCPQNQNYCKKCWEQNLMMCWARFFFVSIFFWVLPLTRH